MHQDIHSPQFALALARCRCPCEGPVHRQGSFPSDSECLAQNRRAQSASFSQMLWMNFSARFTVSLSFFDQLRHSSLLSLMRHEHQKPQTPITFLRLIEEDLDPSVHPCDHAQKKMIACLEESMDTGVVDGTKSLLVYQRLGPTASEELSNI